MMTVSKRRCRKLSLLKSKSSSIHHSKMKFLSIVKLFGKNYFLGEILVYLLPLSVTDTISFSRNGVHSMEKILKEWNSELSGIEVQWTFYYKIYLNKKPNRNPWFCMMT